MNLYTNVLNNLEELKLEKVEENLSGYLDSISGNDITTLGILKDLTDMEIDFKQVST